MSVRRTPWSGLKTLVRRGGHRHDVVMVRVEPVTPPWAEALRLGDAAFADRFGISVVSGWGGFPETVPLLARYAASGQPPEWGPHLVFDEDGALVGTGGWKGAPVDGVAELGYAVAPARRDRGIATAVVGHLLTAARDAGLRVAVAHTLTMESSSAAVLRECGFRQVGEFVDPDDRPIWRWERSPRA